MRWVPRSILPHGTVHHENNSAIVWPVTMFKGNTVRREGAGRGVGSVELILKVNARRLRWDIAIRRKLADGEDGERGR